MSHQPEPWTRVLHGYFPLRFATDEIKDLRSRGVVA